MAEGEARRKLEEEVRRHNERHRKQEADIAEMLRETRQRHPELQIPAPAVAPAPAVELDLDEPIGMNFTRRQLIMVRERAARRRADQEAARANREAERERHNNAPDEGEESVEDP
ncbi:hypothetical protein O6H91_Y494800 [Diphasiastrum complanatum]|nr:hypothetical protein O6H91_Y494800 [Diphasiastrum complanatum]